MDGRKIEIADIVNVNGQADKPFVVTFVDYLGGMLYYELQSDDGETIFVMDSEIIITGLSVEKLLGTKMSNEIKNRAVHRLHEEESTNNPIPQMDRIEQAIIKRPKTSDYLAGSKANRPFPSDDESDVENAEQIVDDVIRQVQIDSLLERLHMQISKGRAASSIATTKRQLKKLTNEQKS